MTICTIVSRWFTYSFMHNGYEHLLSNTFIMLIIGLPLELVHKWYRILCIFILGCIAGKMNKEAEWFSTTVNSGSNEIALGKKLLPVV